MQTRRLASGGRIDRKKPLNFVFNGKPYQGFVGDTLASALLANGVDVVARSYKFARPRGIVGHGAEEPNAIVQLGVGAVTVPNVRATEVELYEGLEASSVGAAGAAGLVLRALIRSGTRLLPAWFYYKIMMRPQRLHAYYQRVLRSVAGRGKTPVEPDPDSYDKLNQHCDVLIVGAGPAGLAAAVEAARSGARVIVADEQNECGGSLLAARQHIGGRPADQWVGATVAELRNCEEAELLPRSTVFGAYGHNFLAILQRRTDHRRISSPGVARQRLHRVRAKQVVLATGAIERPLVFANNDVPGVMLAASLSTYINRYAVAPGNSLLICTASDSAYLTAIDWRQCGRKAVAVVDVRANPGGALVQAVANMGVPVISGHGVIQVLGRKRVRAAMVAPLDAQGVALTGKTRRLPCDLIACSGGWSPAIHLSCHTGGSPRWSQELAAFLPADATPQQHAAGAANGTYRLRDCLLEGAYAGARAAQLAGFGNGGLKQSIPDVEELEYQPPQAVFLLPHNNPVSRAPKQFVDLQMDVTAADILQAISEGYASLELVKRYTGLGLGTDQGKLGNVNGAAILAGALGQSIAATGTTVFRPAYTPVSFGALAGRDVNDLFDAVRYTPLQRWHEQHGAEWENLGQWRCPRYYRQPFESMQDAVNRECLAVRNRVGILDASTLGKIDVQGLGAAEFLERIFVNSYRDLPPGSCRFGLMLREDGMIFSAAITACLGDNHYLITVATTQAEAVLDWLERWQQTEWPELAVYFTAVTEHWSTVTIAGPLARKVLSKISDRVNLDAGAFQKMAWREGVVAGVPARLFRISFSGELCFEVNVPAHHYRHVWQQVIAAGEEFDITPYGTEAMRILRAERGFMVIGQDTDGSMTPADMGMHGLVESDKPFSFIGKRGLSMAASMRGDRPQLVGLKTVNPATVLPEGAQIIDDPQPATLPMAAQGHVTCSCFSANLDRSIALAMVNRGSQRMGETVRCTVGDGRTTEAEIVGRAFLDRDGDPNIE